jgi:hypothetical protein
MRQSTLPFKTEQESQKREDQFKRKGVATRRVKPISNHKDDYVFLKDDSVEVVGEHMSTPDKK